MEISGWRTDVLAPVAGEEAVPASAARPGIEAESPKRDRDRSAAPGALGIRTAA